MWTMSGFADEIDPDLKTQCTVLNDLGINHVEFRSAWNTNVLDLTDEETWKNMIKNRYESLLMEIFE